jgi:hypothetical protein
MRFAVLQGQFSKSHIHAMSKYLSDTSEQKEENLKMTVKATSRDEVHGEKNQNMGGKESTDGMEQTLKA